MQNKTSQNIIGPDLNEYRGEVNYSLLATKTPYSYLRGSGYGSGRFRVDRKFIEYVQGLKNVGIKTGAYHYAVPSYDLNTADIQCDGFIDTLQQAYGPGNYGDLFPVIDIEAPLDKSISTDALLDWVDRFRKRFERRTRRKMMIYTGAFFIELYNNFYHTKKGFILSDMPLWIAMYPEIQPNPPYPKDQGGWTRWRMWQFTENGTIAGVNPPVDLNYGPTNLDLLTQPRKVSNFRAVTSGQSIMANWNANTDVDLAGYNIFLNSNYVTTLGKNATSYNLPLASKPVQVERYEISIEAFDTDGDFSQERAKAVVTFNRSDLNYINDNNQLEYTREKCECKEQANPTIPKKRFIDPVDLLEKRFTEPYIEGYYKENSQESYGDRENGRKLYGDFVESENEFDDVLYMKIIENEKAYRRYYNEDKEYRCNFYDTNEDDDCDKRDNPNDEKCYNCPKCNNYEKEWHKVNDENDHDHNDDHECDKDHDHHKFDKEHDHHDNYHHNDNHECDKDHDHHKFDKEHDHHDNYHHNDDHECDKDHDHHKFDKEHDHHDDDKCDKDYDYDDDKWDKDKDKDNKYEYKPYENKCNPVYKEKCREEYEGDRRRLENHESRKLKKCEDCVQDKMNCIKCEYLLEDMYLNNCDYGHKKSKDKKKYNKQNDTHKCGKKKSKKHHHH